MVISVIGRSYHPNTWPYLDFIPRYTYQYHLALWRHVYVVRKLWFLSYVVVQLSGKFTIASVVKRVFGYHGAQPAHSPIP